MDAGDVQRVFDERCTAVLNLQTQMGLSQRQINPADISNMFYTRGITTYARYQVADSFRAEYADDLLSAAKLLHELVDVKKERVFVHDQTGVSRCTTLLIVYLALFIKHKSWRNIDELYALVEGEYQWQDANKEIAKYVIEQNKWFQEQQYQLLQNSTLQSEANRLRMIRLKE
jgi:hypothetical protein